MPRRVSRRAPRRSRGFTLIELIVVVAILTTLAGLLLPMVGDYARKSRQSQARTDLDILASAFLGYHADTGQWPSNGRPQPVTTASTELLAYPCMYLNLFELPGWSGPYLNRGVLYFGQMRMAKQTFEGGGDGGGCGSAAANGMFGLLDPWEATYQLVTFAPGYAGSSGALLVLSKGPNGVQDSTRQELVEGRPADDDLLQVISRHP